MYIYHQRSGGKVMFSQVYVCPQGTGLSYPWYQVLSGGLGVGYTQGVGYRGGGERRVLPRGVKATTAVGAHTAEMLSCC